MIYAISYDSMIGTNIRVKSRQALLAMFKILLKFFGYMLTKRNYDKTLAFTIRFCSRDLTGNGWIAELIL